MGLKEALPQDFLLKVFGGLGVVGGAAEVAPVVFVIAEGEDFYPSGQTVHCGMRGPWVEGGVRVS